MRLRPGLLVSTYGPRQSSEVVVSRPLLRATPQEPCPRGVEAESAGRRATGVEAPPRRRQIDGEVAELCLRQIRRRGALNAPLRTPFRAAQSLCSRQICRGALDVPLGALGSVSAFALFHPSGTPKGPRGITIPFAECAGYRRDELEPGDTAAVPHGAPAARRKRLN